MEERGGHLPARRVPVRLMRIDVNVFLGAYPYRRVPGTAPEALRRSMERVAIDAAWVSHLPSLFWGAPPEGNAWLYEAAAAERRFQPVPAVHPGLGGWEAVRVWWDISWIWGPPEDHLETLLQTIGVERFVFGTGQPLRLPETSVAKLDLLDLSPDERAAIESGNVTRGLTT